MIEDIKGLSFPLRFGANGHLVRDEGVAKLITNLKVILSTRINELPYSPDLGTVGYARVHRNAGESENAIIQTLVRDSIAKLENRVVVRQVKVTTKKMQTGTAQFVQVWFQVRDTQQEGAFELRVGGDQ